MSKIKIVVVGGGWGGCAAAIAAVKAGADAVLLERADMLLGTQVRLGKLRHVIFGDQVDVFEFDTVFTLFELVEGIGWELGFHGTPRECQIRR